MCIRDSSLALSIIISLFGIAISNATESPNNISSIYWSDADSGRINGKLKFRLNSVDAPETGGVGAAIGGAKCELERKRGYESKEWIVGLTRNAETIITSEYGLDRHDRLIVDLSVSGEDLGQAGKAYWMDFTLQGSATDSKIDGHLLRVAKPFRNDKTLAH